MPRRTNKWQGLIHTIQVQLVGKAGVTESKELVNRVTGCKREVDIVIETEVGNHSLTIGIECKGSESMDPRPVDVEWVERMIQKHAHLPTDKLILVAEAGFTPQAAEMARWSWVDTLSFGEAVAADWTTVVGKLTHVYIAMPQSTPTSCDVFFARGYSQDAMPAANPETVIHDSQGRVQGTTLQIAYASLQQPLISEHVIRNFNEAGDYAFAFDCTLSQGSYITDAAGTAHEVAKLRFQVAVHVEPRIPVALQHRSLRDVQVAFGLVDSLGKDALLSIVEQEGKPRSSALRLPSKKGGKAKTILFAPAEGGEQTPSKAAVVEMNPIDMTAHLFGSQTKTQGIWLGPDARRLDAFSSPSNPRHQ